MIIITGTSSGIGKEIALHLISKGQKVVGVARREASIDSELYTHIRGDVCDPKLHEQLASLDVTGIVFNHGVLDQVAPVAEADTEKWKWGFDVNFFSVVAITKALLPKLRASNARVIFVSSSAAVHAFKTWGCYGSTKAALNHFALTLAAEEPSLVPVSVEPGVVDTEMQQSIRTTHASSMGAQNALFHELHSNGSLSNPVELGKIYGNLVLGAEQSLAGKSLGWQDEPLKKYL